MLEEEKVQAHTSWERREELEMLLSSSSTQATLGEKEMWQDWTRDLAKQWLREYRS